MSYITRRGLPIILVLVAGAGSVAGCSDATDSGQGTRAAVSSVVAPDALLTVDEFERFVDDNDPALINVHIPYDGHIADTDAFIAFDSIVDDPNLPEDLSAPIALYCRSGNMSATATDALIDAGYTNVVDLDGGMIAWSQTGRSLLTDPEAAK